MDMAALPDSHPLQALDTAPVNRAIAAAADLPDLLGKLKVASPPAYAQLTGKPLIEAKTPIGTAAVSLVAFLAAKYGLGWDADTCAIIGGAGVIVGSYLMRSISSVPIYGIFRRPANLASHDVAA